VRNLVSILDTGRLWRTVFLQRCNISEI